MSITFAPIPNYPSYITGTSRTPKAITTFIVTEDKKFHAEVLTALPDSSTSILRGFLRLAEAILRIFYISPKNHATWKDIGRNYTEGVIEMIPIVNLAMPSYRKEQINQMIASVKNQLAAQSEVFGVAINDEVQFTLPLKCLNFYPKPKQSNPETPEALAKASLVLSDKVQVWAKTEYPDPIENGIKTIESGLKQYQEMGTKMTNATVLERTSPPTRTPPPPPTNSENQSNVTIGKAKQLFKDLKGRIRASGMENK